MDDGRVLDVGTEPLNPSFARGKLHRSTHVFCIDGIDRMVGKIKSNMCCGGRWWVDKGCTGIVLCGIALGHTGVANAFVERGCSAFGPNTIGIAQFHPICESVTVRIFQTQFLRPLLVLLFEIFAKIICESATVGRNVPHSWIFITIGDSGLVFFKSSDVDGEKEEEDAMVCFHFFDLRISRWYRLRTNRRYLVASRHENGFILINLL